MSRPIVFPKSLRRSHPQPSLSPTIVPKCSGCKRDASCTMPRSKHTRPIPAVGCAVVHCRYWRQVLNVVFSVGYLLVVCGEGTLGRR